MDDRLYRYLSGLLIKVFEVTETNESLQTTELPTRESDVLALQSCETQTNL